MYGLYDLRIHQRATGILTTSLLLQGGIKAVFFVTLTSKLRHII
jgi:hypothetical protein